MKLYIKEFCKETKIEVGFERNWCFFYQIKDNQCFFLQTIYGIYSDKSGWGINPQNRYYFLKSQKDSMMKLISHKIKSHTFHLER